MQRNKLLAKEGQKIWKTVQHRNVLGVEQNFTRWGKFQYEQEALAVDGTWFSANGQMLSKEFYY